MREAGGGSESSDLLALGGLRLVEAVVAGVADSDGAEGGGGGCCVRESPSGSDELEGAQEHGTGDSEEGWQCLARPAARSPRPE